MSIIGIKSEAHKKEIFKTSLEVLPQLAEMTFADFGGTSEKAGFIAQAFQVVKQNIMAEKNTGNDFARVQNTVAIEAMLAFCLATRNCYYAAPIEPKSKDSSLDGLGADQRNLSVQLEEAMELFGISKPEPLQAAPTPAVFGMTSEYVSELARLKMKEAAVVAAPVINAVPVAVKAILSDKPVDLRMFSEQITVEQIEEFNKGHSSPIPERVWRVFNARECIVARTMLSKNPISAQKVSGVTGYSRHLLETTLEGIFSKIDMLRKKPAAFHVLSESMQGRNCVVDPGVFAPILVQKKKRVLSEREIARRSYSYTSWYKKQPQR